MSEKRIVKCAIHPAIGIARVGNSPDEYFIGPEVPGVVPTPPGGFKDSQGRIKRQAARFRLYGYDAQGEVVREITAKDADVQLIEWTVHLANQKAAWYDFDQALDIPESAGIASTPRNPDWPQEKRDELVIDPGPRTLQGPEKEAFFDNGTFKNVVVPLGSIHTDADGRLLVLGGFGHSDAPGVPEEEKKITGFANNANWHDDTSDGPVTARVIIDGQELEVVPSWVLVAPPDYAPGIQSVVTIYDVLEDLAYQANPPQVAEPVSFLKQIYPILERFSDTQWVNKGFYLEFGWRGPMNFLHPDMLQALSNPSDTYRPLRQEIFEKFRQPDYDRMEREAYPYFYGDAMDIPATSPRNWLAMTPLQYGWLKRWAEGDFVNDYNPDTLAKKPQKFADIPLAVQPHALDRAALDETLGGAFHPGCEATWPIRIASMYSAPFRFKHAPANAPIKTDYGPVLTPAIALSPEGPLANGNRAGDITRWMAVPWQSDTASCRSGYEPRVNPYLPTFWPARVPNQVLSMGNYSKVMDKTLPMAARQQAFDERTDWLEYFPGTLDGVRYFVSDWWKAGIIVSEDGPQDAQAKNAFPPKIHTERWNGMKN